MVNRLRCHQAITETPGFDYGASGRGGWDETSTGVVQTGERRKKKRRAFNPYRRLLRLTMQGRSAAEVIKMKAIRRNGMFIHLPGIYLIENTVTGDQYIGTSCRIVSRWRQHIMAMRRQNHHCKKMNVLYRRHGENSFRFKLIEHGDRGRNKREWQLIQERKPSLNPATT